MGYEQAVKGAQDGPLLGGSRHWVAGGPVGYKHGMRDEMRGRGQKSGVARAAQQPLGNGEPRDERSRLVMGSCKGERGIAGLRTN